MRYVPDHVSVAVWPTDRLGGARLRPMGPPTWTVKVLVNGVRALPEVSPSAHDRYLSTNDLTPSQLTVVRRHRSIAEGGPKYKELQPGWDFR